MGKRMFASSIMTSATGRVAYQWRSLGATPSFNQKIARIEMVPRERFLSQNCLTW